MAATDHLSKAQFGGISNILPRSSATGLNGPLGSYGLPGPQGTGMGGMPAGSYGGQ